MLHSSEFYLLVILLRVPLVYSTQIINKNKSVSSILLRSYPFIRAHFISLLQLGAASLGSGQPAAAEGWNLPAGHASTMARQTGQGGRERPLGGSWGNPMGKEPVSLPLIISSKQSILSPISFQGCDQRGQGLPRIIRVILLLLKHWLPHADLGPGRTEGLLQEVQAAMSALH